MPACIFDFAVRTSVRSHPHGDAADRNESQEHLRRLEDGTEICSDNAERQSVSPLALIERVISDIPALYLSNGLYGAFVNFKGTEGLAALARQHSVGTHERY